MKQDKFEMDNRANSVFNQHIVFPGVEEVPQLETGNMVQAGRWVKTTIGSVLNDQRLQPELKLGFDKAARKQVIFSPPQAGYKGNAEAQAYWRGNRPNWVVASSKGDVLS